MIFFTKAIVLLKQPFKEYDEKVCFFSEEKGKIWTFAYGTRSIKSKRKALLSSNYWLNILLEKKKDFLILKEVELVTSINFFNKYEKFLFWSELIKDIYQFFPLNIPEKEVFTDIFLMSQPIYFQFPVNYHFFILYYQLLKKVGLFPIFTNCLMCGFDCNKEYFFVINQGFISKKCLKSKEIKRFPKIIGPFSKSFLELLNNFYEQEEKGMNYFQIFYQEYLKYVIYGERKNRQEWERSVKLITSILFNH